MKHSTPPPLAVSFTRTGTVPTKAQRPHVPVGPAEIVEQVHDAHNIGITVVHLHGRRTDGILACEPEICAETFAGVRRHRPELPICASLSGIGAAQMRANSLAIMDGGGVRVRLKDNLCFDAGRGRLATIAMLPNRVHEVAAYFERTLMPPAEFRALRFSNRQRPADVI